MTKLYGLIGNPLGHSFSSRFFTAKFNREGIDACYRNFELQDIGELYELLSEYPELEGLNVTSPFKEQVLPFLTEIENNAKKIGAVNCIKIERSDNDVRLIGFNTDYMALKEILPRLFTYNPSGKILILGTGGAAKAAKAALGRRRALMVSRDALKGDITYDRLEERIGDWTPLGMVINATPLGMAPHLGECPPFPYHRISSDTVCLDMVYNPAVTEFMERCAGQGACVKNGSEMLYRQARHSWKLWNGKF